MNNKIFIIDDVTMILLLKNKEIRELIRKINKESGVSDKTEKYCDEIEDIIRRDYGAEEIVYGDFTITEDMLKECE